MSEERLGSRASPPGDQSGLSQIQLPVRPSRPEDRGEISVRCPNCSALVFAEMSDGFIASYGKPVRCACRAWVSPLPSEPTPPPIDPLA